MPEGYPKHAKANPLTVGHVKTLVYGQNSDRPFLGACSDVVQQVVDIDVKKLALLDFYHLLLFLRVNSCGSFADFTFTCPVCKTPSPLSVDLTAVKAESVPSSYSEPKEVDGVRLQLPRVADRIALDEVEHTDLDELSLFLAIEGGITKRLDVFNACSPKAIENINLFVESLSGLGVDNSVSFLCQSKPSAEAKPCGCKEEILWPFRGTFFLPGKPQKHS